MSLFQPSHMAGTIHTALMTYKLPHDHDNEMNVRSISLISHITNTRITHFAPAAAKISAHWLAS